MLQLKILHASAKTQHSQMNEFLKTTFFFKKRKVSGSTKCSLIASLITKHARAFLGPCTLEPEASAVQTHSRDLTSSTSSTGLSFSFCQRRGSKERMGFDLGRG